MVSPFEIVVKKLSELGFYDFLIPFIISSVVFYAVLKKSKILGDSPVLNGILSLSIAFMIFGFPILTGITLGISLATFFTQLAVFALIFIVALVIASVFYPDLTKTLTETFKSRNVIWIMIAIGFTLMITSGLITAIFSPAVFGGGAGKLGPPTDVLMLVAGLVIFMVLLIIAAATARGA